MEYVSHRAALRRNGEDLSTHSLPLFVQATDSTADLHPNMSMAARRIAKRFGIPLHLARLVAEQAGFRCGADHD